MSDSYNFPESISTLLNKHVTQCKNLALILDKYPPAHILGNNQGKSEWLIRLKPNDHIDTTLTRSVYNRWYAMMSALEATHFNANLDWRMVVGLGGESVLETDITLHHLYGIPFIPGSALKGLTRAYVAEEYEEYYVPEKQPEELRQASKKTDDDHSEINRIFGTQKDAGTVIFFDAMPLNGAAQFTLDIMNPHYPEYYGGNKPPTNDQNPNPVTFLTVTSTAFTFALAPRSPKDLNDVEQAKMWLQEALQKYGVGGKTSAGYGYFQRPLELSSSKLLSSEGEALLAQKPELPQRIRPIIKRPGIGQGIQGKIIEPTEQLHQTLALEGDFLFLRYMEYDPRDIFIVVEKHELEKLNMLGRKEYYLLVSEIYENDGCIVVVGRPKPPKNKKKK